MSERGAPTWVIIPLDDRFPPCHLDILSKPLVILTGRLDRPPNFEEGGFPRWPKLSSTDYLETGTMDESDSLQNQSVTGGPCAFWFLYATDKEIDL